MGFLTSVNPTVRHQKNQKKYYSGNKKQHTLKFDRIFFSNAAEVINQCREAKDNQYLELAVSGNVQYIITGDDDLLVLNPLRNIEIITVPEFIHNN